MKNTSCLDHFLTIRTGVRSKSDGLLDTDLTRLRGFPEMIFRLVNDSVYIVTVNKQQPEQHVQMLR